ncbi:hypothetical protein SGMN_06330 [Stenotrophomonas geniculata]
MSGTVRFRPIGTDLMPYRHQQMLDGCFRRPQGRAMVGGYPRLCQAWRVPSAKASPRPRQTSELAAQKRRPL